MRTYLSYRLTSAALTLFAVATLSACGSSTNSEGATADSPQVATEEAAVSEGGAEEIVDVTFMVTVYLDTIWPIEGNPYADAPAAKGWCATYSTNPAETIAAVQVYLSVEPDIAAANPTSVSTAIDEYLTNNCYLTEE